MGAYDDAIAYGQRALTLRGDRGCFQQASVHGFLGTVYFYLGEYRRAIDALRQAMVLRRRVASARFGGMMVAAVRDRLWLTALPYRIGGVC